MWIVNFPKRLKGDTISAMKVIRVFPRRTHLTPRDDYAFVGDPPFIRPDADEVHVSCTFTWDITKARRLKNAWAQYYPKVMLGGTAIAASVDGFTPGMYVKRGSVFTSRGCNNQCPWCLVPLREGNLREIPIHLGNNVHDNNLLQCSKEHQTKVFDMLRGQHSIQLSGGLESALVTDNIADEIRSLRISQLFLAADTKAALKPLERAIQRLQLPRAKVRCFALLAYEGESISHGLERLETIWNLGAMPFAQLYQPPDHYIQYSLEWKKVQWVWTRPAPMKAMHKL